MSSSSLVFSVQLSCCRAVSQQQSLLAANPPGGNGQIAVAQATEHFHLLTPGHNPKYPPGAIKHRIRQRHPAPALVDSGQGHVFIGNIEYGIARYQRSSVAVGTETEVDGSRTGGDPAISRRA